MYELIEWKGNYNNSLQVQFQQVSLESVLESSINLSDLPGWEETETEGIDIIDISFDSTVKSRDRIDYLFALLSGVVAGMIDYTVVGKTDFKELLGSELSIDPKNLNSADVQKILTVILMLYKFNSEQMNRFDCLFDHVFQKAEDTLHRTPQYKSIVKDFGSSMSIKSIVTKIICRLIGCNIGLDEDGNITVEKIQDDDFDKLTFIQKIQLAFTEWFFEQVNIYVSTRHFDGEENGIFAFKEGIDSLKKGIREVSNLKIFKDKTIDGTQAYHWFKHKMLQETSDNDELLDIKKLLVKQAIPVVINKGLIRTYMFINKFKSDMKDKNVQSIDGLEFINPAFMSVDDLKRADFLEGFAGLIFESMDLAGATVYGVSAGIAAGNPVAGVYAFATAVNFVNICNLVTICRRNKDEIIDAIKSKGSEQKIKNYIKEEELRKTENERIIIDYLSLNPIETKILYSLELQIVNDDIYSTRDSQTQILKNQWKKEWMKLSKESVDLSKLFEEDSQKLYSMINTRIENGNYNGWLHRIALEIALFAPYFPLKEDDEQWKKLKFAKKNYIEDVFCTNQNMITVAQVKELLKTYNKYFNALEHKQEKTVVGVAGAVVVAAGTAVVAFTFAPAIAVAIAGHFFTGLSGVALTNACLALFGGGAIAAGGLGMAGGALVIAGGGAVVGLGVTGGMTATAMLLLTSPSYIQRDQAKLLTTCEKVLLNKYGKKKDVEKIRNQILDNIGQLRVRLEVIKSIADENKEYRKDSSKLVKELEKSYEIMENSVDLLDKMMK